MFLKKILRRIRNNVSYTDLAFARKGFETLVSQFNGPLAGFTYTPATIAGMKCEWIIPDGADESKVLLYFHGGGYATGSINTHRALVSQIAKNANIKALIIEYRMAPEFKYPVPIEDAANAYQWLLQNGFTAAQVAFGGDSAGGGMSICALLYLRDNHIPLPKCAFAISPWLDHTVSGRSYITNRDIDPMLVPEGIPYWSKIYMGGADPRAPYASPIFHDLTGLPPIYIQVGEEEMLLDDSVRFEEKASRQGVNVIMEIYPKLFHVFNGFWRLLPQARVANHKLGEFLKDNLKQLPHQTLFLEPE